MKAAREKAIEQLGGKDQFERAKKLPITLLYTTKMFDDEVTELEKVIKNAEKDAKQQWEKDEIYGLNLAKRTIEKIEKAVYESKSEANASGENPDTAGVKTAYHLATIEIAKLQTAQTRIGESKGKNEQVRIAAYRDAMDIQNAVDSVRRPNFPGSAPRRAHLWIDPTSGRIMDHNDAPIVGHVFQNIQSIGASHDQGKRDTHAGITFTDARQNQDVSYADLASEDEKWTTRTRIYLHEPDGNGGYRDMIYFANGMKIPLTDVNFAATSNAYDATKGVTLVTNDGKQFNLQKMDRQGHLEINPQTGKITMGRNRDSAAVHFYLQDVATFGNAQTHGASTRTTHTGMVFKETLRDPAGSELKDWDVGHDHHLSGPDDSWKTKTYIHILPDGKGSGVEMLHLADGTWLNVDYIDLSKTEYTPKDGVTIILKPTSCATR